MATALDKMASALDKLKIPAANGAGSEPPKTLPLTFKMTPICPKLVVKIRPSASATEPHIGVIKSGQEIEVYTQRENGFYKLTDGRGYVNKNTVGVTWNMPEWMLPVAKPAANKEESAELQMLSQTLSLTKLKQLNIKPRHQGVLLKLSDWLKDWRPRYFALYGTRLFICKDINPSETEEPKVEIDFSNINYQFNAVIVMSPDRSSSSTHIMELRMTNIADRPKGLTLRSACHSQNDAQDDLMQWVEAINDVALKAIANHEQQQNSPSTSGHRDDNDAPPSRSVSKAVGVAPAKRNT